MVYFNGFSLQDEEDLFEEYVIESDLYVVGFSYGAQQAFEYVYQSKERIDRLTKSPHNSMKPTRKKI